MKTFCPNCEKQTDSTFICEVHMCNECNEDYGSYEKPVSTAAEKKLQDFVKQTMDTVSTIYTACTYQTSADAGAGTYSLPLLVWADLEKLIQQAHDLLDGVYDGTYLNIQISTDVKTSSDNNKPSDFEGSVTQDIGKSEIADQVMKIIGDALSGDCQRYLNYDLHGKRYCKWGIVEKDIRALLETSTDNNKVSAG